MGAQLYENIAGVWFEESESAGGITMDFDAAGDKPNDTGNYGLYFIRHFIDIRKIFNISCQYALVDKFQWWKSVTNVQSGPNLNTVY